jgi:hypothetical protein
MEHNVMSSEKFEASTQYNDLTGSSAADRADDGDAHDWLKDQGLIADGEYLLGIEAYISPSTFADDSDIMVNVYFYIVAAESFDSAVASAKQAEVVNGRKLSREMTTKDFFSLFKRFSITLSSGGELEGREFSNE